MSLKKQIIEIIAELKNIFRFAMFNYKNSHSIEELNYYIERYCDKIRRLQIDFAARNENLKKYLFLYNSENSIVDLFKTRRYYELAVLANNIYHQLGQVADMPLTEYDFVVFNKDADAVDSRKINDRNIDAVNNGKIRVILDNIRSPFNVGAFFRTGDAVGIDELYLCGITPTPENIRVTCAAMGADKVMKWRYCRFAEAIVEDLKLRGTTKIFSVETSSNCVRYDKPDYKNIKDITFVFGNEEFGINENIIRFSDCVIGIEMFGLKNSLNVAIAGGIVLYQYRMAV